MRHCTVCGWETEQGTMMRVSRGPKQFLCDACAEEQKSNNAVGVLIVIGALIVIFFMAISGISNRNHSDPDPIPQTIYHDTSPFFERFPE